MLFSLLLVQVFCCCGLESQDFKMISVFTRLLLARWLLCKLPHSKKCRSSEAGPRPSQGQLPQAGFFGELHHAQPALEGGEASCPCNCPPWTPVSVAGHLLKQLALLLLLFFSINLIGHAEVLLFVPYDLAKNAVRAPSLSHALRQNSDHLCNCLVVGLFVFAADVILMAHVVHHVRRLLYLDALETLIISCLPQWFLDSWTQLIKFIESYFK